MNYIEAINKEIEPLTPKLRRQIQNIIDFHGINKDTAAYRIAEVLKQPLKENKIHDILTM